MHVSRRPMSLAAAFALIGVGLIWRMVPMGLPGFAVKYGGSILWAAMVYCIVVALLPRVDARGAAMTAAAISTATELSRLYHQPWLDDFRMTLPGALLLGRIFSPWDLVAYAAGIGTAALGDRLVGHLKNRITRSAHFYRQKCNLE